MPAVTSGTRRDCSLVNQRRCCWPSAGLALGLGIATAAFSILNAALRGNGIVDGDRLPGVLRTTARATSTTWAYDEFLRLRDGATRMQVEAVLTDAALIRTSAAEADPPSARLAFVSGGFFAATGGRVMVGRSVAAADERAAGAPNVVISHAFWTSRLNADPRVLGRTISVGRTTATIVGVTERAFSAPNSPSAWMPLTSYTAVYDATSSSRAPDGGLQVFGRLLPDVTLLEAQAQLNGVAAALPRAQATGEPVGVRLDVRAGLGRMPAADSLAISVFAIVVIALVLLLACGNVATVLVSTAITREREMGVRIALGASRWRIVRQLVTESVALGAIAAGFGLVIASWSIPLIGRMIEAPPDADLAPDLAGYVFLVSVTLLTGVAAGLAPAWHGRGADLLTPLKGEGAGSHRMAPRRLRFMLVMTQAAISLLLIVLAALFVRATLRVAAIDVGFDAESLYTVSHGLGQAAGEDAAIRTYWTRAVAALDSVPGVRAVSLVELTPFDGTTRTAITREQAPRIVYFNRTDASYFETMGLPMVAGRAYTRAEVAAKAPVAVVSESLARAFWPTASPIGQTLPPEIPLVTLPEFGLLGIRPVIIGVVANVVTAQLHERGAFAVYEPLDPASVRFARMMVRTTPGTSALSHANQRLRSIDRQADVTITSVAAQLRQEADRPRMLAMLTGIVGLIAIALCVIGLYGLTAALVNQRTREMGVRIAIGAHPSDLLRLLMWDSLKPAALGVALGGGTAVLAGQVAVASMFFGVSPRDPVALAAAAAILLGAAALAVLVPTRRAARVDAASVLWRP
jgi:predicted permease